MSQYPKTYVIQSYCLGHREFVSKIHVPRFATAENPVVVSGGGEGLVNLWDIKEGKLLSSTDIKKAAEEELKTPIELTSVHAIASCPISKVVAVVAEGIPLVFIFSGVDKLTVTQLIRLQENPTSVTFDVEGRLWVSTDSSTALVRHFHLTKVKFEETGDKEVSLINTTGSVMGKLHLSSH